MGRWIGRSRDAAASTRSEPTRQQMVCWRRWITRCLDFDQRFHCSSERDFPLHDLYRGKDRMAIDFLSGISSGDTWLHVDLCSARLSVQILQWSFTNWSWDNIIFLPQCSRLTMRYGCINAYKEVHLDRASIQPIIHASHCHDGRGANRRLDAHGRYC